MPEPFDPQGPFTASELAIGVLVAMAAIAVVYAVMFGLPA
jgi:hypothetical protein